MSHTNGTGAGALKAAFEHPGRQYASDKWSSYFGRYEQLFDQLRDRPVGLLEIGVQNGGSLETWARYFPHATAIVGVDIDPSCANLAFEDSRISVVVGDAGETATEGEILGRSSGFDIIIDDGSHRAGDIIRTFSRLFRHLRDGGVYVVEDLHASYWHAYGGGLFNPYSSMAFFKTLADVINAEHWLCRITSKEVLDAFAAEHQCSFEHFPFGAIHQVSFWNSLCGIRREAPALNRVGTRVITGTTQNVAQLSQEQTVHPSESEDSSEWSRVMASHVGLAREHRRLTTDQERLNRERDALAARVSAEEKRANSCEVEHVALAREHRRLITDRERLNRERDALAARVLVEEKRASACEAELLMVTSSMSWRITKPLRGIRQLLARAADAKDC